MADIDVYTHARFWSKVEVNGRHETACWPWRGGLDGSGYGVFKLHSRQQPAHRVAYELANGAILDDSKVLHACDNPACCNPRHLGLGTLSQNMSDMVARGRHKNRIDPALRAEIAAAHGTRTELAARFSVSPRTITTIKKQSASGRRVSGVCL